VRNWDIERGATWDRTVTWLAGIGDDQAPVDLTGATARMQIRSAPRMPVLASVTCSISEPETGRIDLLLTAAQTAHPDFKAGAYRYDLEVEFAGGVVRRLLEGEIRIKPNITEDLS
jgi:hypothetical protein